MSIQPPGPNGIPLFGNSRQYANDPFGFMEACADAYGDVVRFDLGPMPIYMLTNPRDIERVLADEHASYRKPDLDDAMDELLGEGLLLSEGETWRRQRTLANPAFRADRLGGLDGMILECVTELLDGWSPGDRIDIHSEMAHVTVRIIVNAMFGIDIDENRVRTVQENLEPLGARFEPDPMRVLVPGWVPTRENVAFATALETIESIVAELIESRRRRGDYHGREGDRPMDLLSILLRAMDEGEQTATNLRDEMVTMLLAGHDTTALTLTYTWYLLSEHPDVRDRLHGELDDVLGGELPRADDLRALEYTGWVLNEAMRLYPPVYTIFREPAVDVQLGGYRIPAGAGLMLPQWVVHRSPRWYDDPDTFDPERWAPDRRADRPRFSFFPFGGGPRHCIGKQLSLLEATLIIGTVAQTYDLAYLGDGGFGLRGSLTMHPDQPVAMRIRSRDTDTVGTQS